MRSKYGAPPWVCAFSWDVLCLCWLALIQSRIVRSRRPVTVTIRLTASPADYSGQQRRRAGVDFEEKDEKVD